jgi:hypothetical protein
VCASPYHYAHDAVVFTYKPDSYVHLCILLLGVCSVVCLEIVMSIPKTADLAQTDALGAKSTPPKSVHAHVPSYGFSLIIGWIVFVIYILAGLLFLLFSKKLKGIKAPTSEVNDANEPLQLSRP